MCCKKMIRFFNWLKRVYEGWKNVLTGNVSDESKRRLEICMNCDDKIQITKKEYICSHCGCVLRAKCASLNETCDMNKW